MQFFKKKILSQKFVLLSYFGEDLSCPEKFFFKLWQNYDRFVQERSKQLVPGPQKP